jgi:O-antigen/teichoic acid export membrane protein
MRPKITDLYSGFQNIRKHRQFKNISVLYVSMILGVFFGIIVSVINTRFLGAESFGDFKFIHSVYYFFSIIISFGFLVTSSKLLAEKKNDGIRKELIGSSLIISSCLGILFVIVMVFFALVQKNYFAKDLSSVIIMVSPLFFFVPFIQGMENIYQGDNRIIELAFFRQSPQVMYIIVVLILYSSGLMNLETALISQLSVYGLVIVASTFMLKPKFTNIKEVFKLIFSENRRYGFNVYIGSVIGVSSTHLGPMVISFFSDNNIDVGFYSLALTVTMPLVLIPTVVGTSFFKEFANRPDIPAKATRATIIISLFSLIVFLILIKPMITFLYSKDFAEAANLAYIVSAGQILHGFGNYYNRFLGSKGQGKFLRNGAVAVGITNIAGFIIVIPFFGAYGAAFTKLLSGMVFIWSMLYYYKKFMNKNNLTI